MKTNSLEIVFRYPKAHECEFRESIRELIEDNLGVEIIEINDKWVNLEVKQ
jgi:hypothetical protein